MLRQQMEILIDRLTSAEPWKLSEAVSCISSIMIESALERHKGAVYLAATDLGVKRTALYATCDRLGIALRKKDRKCLPQV